MIRKATRNFIVTFSIAALMASGSKMFAQSTAIATPPPPPPVVTGTNPEPQTSTSPIEMVLIFLHLA